MHLDDNWGKKIKNPVFSQLSSLQEDCNLNRSFLQFSFPQKYFIILIFEAIEIGSHMTTQLSCLKMFAVFPENVIPHYQLED